MFKYLGGHTCYKVITAFTEGLGEPRFRYFIYQTNCYTLTILLPFLLVIGHQLDEPTGFSGGLEQ